ncbi:MAG: hypothetical protein GX660_08385 [Clostridiaceae bacterium]|nr:hypothetical protein [Clostridiaceae bacterium]
MSNKKIIGVHILIIGLCVLFILYNIYALLIASIMTKPTYIETGFTKERVEMLEERYDLKIPEDSVFVSGYYDNAFVDSSIYITFKVPEDKFESIFLHGWYTSTDIDGNKLNNEYTYTGEMYTSLTYGESENGYITANFIGRHPGDSHK